MLSAVLLAGNAVAQTPAAFGGESPVAAETLDAIAGREDLAQIAQAEQNAVVSRSSVNGQSTTGGIAIDDNAFQNLSGLSVVNANTGNNVAINASMNVNISLYPDR